MPRKTNETEKKLTNSSKQTKVAKAKKATKSNIKVDKSLAKNVSAKKAKTTSKNATKKVTKSTSKVSSNKTTKKTSTKKAVSNKKTVKSKPVSIIEYYDLPYRYNQTIVKILAQTPKMLFVYWDISDDDRKAFEEHYGADFFSKTKPVLIVHNETLNYSFEIEINDFANSWYLHIKDANCKYVIELGRRPFSYNSTIKEQYIYVSSSNQMDAPNNHILFEKFNPNVSYKNTATGALTTKDFKTISNYKNMEKIYNIYDLYKKIYKDELFKEILSDELTTPSSNSSSSFK